MKLNETAKRQDLKSCGLTAVRVQVPSRVQMNEKAGLSRFFCLEGRAKLACAKADKQKTRPAGD